MAYPSQVSLLEGRGWGMVCWDRLVFLSVGKTFKVPRLHGLRGTLICSRFSHSFRRGKYLIDCFHLILYYHDMILLYKVSYIYKPPSSPLLCQIHNSNTVKDSWRSCLRSECGIYLPSSTPCHAIQVIDYTISPRPPPSVESISSSIMILNANTNAPCSLAHVNCPRYIQKERKTKVGERKLETKESRSGYARRNEIWIRCFVTAHLRWAPRLSS